VSVPVDVHGLLQRPREQLASLLGTRTGSAEVLSGHEGRGRHGTKVVVSHFAAPRRRVPGWV